MATKYPPHIDTAPSASSHLALCAIVFYLKSICPPHFRVNVRRTFHSSPGSLLHCTALLTSSVTSLCCLLLQDTIYLLPSEQPVAKCIIIDNWALLLMESVQLQNRALVGILKLPQPLHCGQLGGHRWSQLWEHLCFCPQASCSRPATGHNLVRSDLDFCLNSTPFWKLKEFCFFVIVIYMFH